MSNIIDSIKLSGTTYQIQGSGGGGNPTVELTQAQYDALVTAGTVSADTYYIITDAQAGDLTNYYTKTETNTLLNGKQATLVSGTNIKTINNESLLGSGNITIQGGGGKAIEAGRGISITTGETADTVSFDLPISATTNNNLIIGDKSNGVNDLNNSGKSIVFGRYSKVKAYDSLVGGYNCSNEKGQSQVFGNYSKTKNLYEFGCGIYNNSVTGSSTFGDSGNTLFSVGNGTSTSARHNAFEIRQNGDIYITSGGTDIKLQDNLGGGGSSYSAGNGISINDRNLISLVPNISASTGSNSIVANSGEKNYKNTASGNSAFACGLSNKANGKCSFVEGGNDYIIDGNVANGIASHAEGVRNTANGFASHVEGYGNITTNSYEHTSGRYNNSVSASTTFGNSGNTLFSVGNGTSTSERHNAFEIRQNGDIYCSDGTNDVKLQDYLQIKVVKLTQSEYDALSPNYDSNTLYVVTDS